VRLIRLGLAAAILAAAAFFVLPKLLPLASASCPDVEVVFARGTDEPPGVGRVGQAFVGSLRQDTRKSVGSYGVNYPANKDFLAAAQGANDASNHIQQMANNCPNTKLVLGGYSQGAAVIDIVTAAPLPGLGFHDPLPTQAADHVAMRCRPDIKCDGGSCIFVIRLERLIALIARRNGKHIRWTRFGEENLRRHMVPGKLFLLPAVSA